MRIPTQRSYVLGAHNIRKWNIARSSEIECSKKFSDSPKKVRDVQSFIGLAGYYRKFIKDFSKIAKPLTILTKKETRFEWTTEQQKAFDILKEKLTTAPVLHYPDFTRQFIIATDASDYAIGAGTVASAGRPRPAYRLRKQNIK